MCAEFTNHIRVKGLIDKTAEYLPRLLDWVGDKIIFWQTELGSNLVQGDAKVGVKHSLAVTASTEKKNLIIITGIIIQKNYVKVRYSKEITKVRKKPWRIDKVRNPHDTISKDCKPARPKTTTSGGVIDRTTNKQIVSEQL